MKSVLFAVFLLINVPLWALAGGINVRDFGAKGDGIHDDSLAIQKAVAVLNSKKITREMLGLCPVGIHDQSPIIGVGELNEIPEIFFPAGKYRLTQTIVVTGFGNLRGEPGTVLTMEDSSKDMFYFHWAYRNRIEDLEFHGAKNQLLICTCNNESARIVIRNCRFVRAAAAAIDCNSFLRPGGTDYQSKPLPAYEVTWENDIPTLTANDLQGKDRFNNSTLFSCSSSTFSQCLRAINCMADGVTIEDCQVNGVVDPATPPFLLGGPARLLQMRGESNSHVPISAWVESHAYALAIRNSEFTGPAKTLVQHLNPGKTNYPDSVLITETKAEVLQSLLYIENEKHENTPNIFEIRDVQNTGSKKVPIVQWSVIPDRNRLLDGRYIDQPALDAYKAKLFEWPYKILFADNKNLLDSLPDALKNSLSEVPSAKLEKELKVDAVRILRQQPGKKFKAVDFGVDLNAQTDDTEAMKKCLQAAADFAGVCEIELPPVRIDIKDSLPLPEAVIITARGQAQIKQKTPERPVFIAENCRYLVVEHITFNAGGIACDIKAAPNAEMMFSDLGVYSSTYASIRVKAGAGNQARLLVRDSVFMSARQVLDSDVAMAQIDNIWISAYGKMDDQAVIVNRAGGNMLISNILTVPAIMKYHYPPHLPYVKDWPYSDNLRWVDNFGKLSLVDNRWGGEWMGFCIVYNRDPRATLYYDGGLSCCFSDWSKKCILYCEHAPKAAIIKNAGWKMVFPDSAVMLQADYLPKKLNVMMTNMVY